jgi:ABC-2 type transport system permease protein
MAHMVAKALKYVRLYRTLTKYSLISAMTYRVNFVFQLAVELGWQVVFVLFFVVVLGNVHAIAGWSYYQVMFLTGLNIVASEVILSAIFIFGLWKLPASIKDGDIDVALLKPISPLFNLSLSRPYFAGFVATIPGFMLMIFALSHLQLHLPIIGLVLSTALFGCGLVIAYAISVIMASLCFYFVNVTALPMIASSIVIDFKSNPMDAYTGVVRAIFFFIIPIVFISSVPAAALTRTIEPGLIMAAPLFAIVLLVLAVKVWNFMIKYYSSASS